MRKRNPLSAAIAVAVVSSVVPQISNAQSTDVALEEILVTGSFIKGNTEQMAQPVEVMGREALANQGLPNATEMILNMPWMSNTINQSEQFQSNGEQTGTKNVNIRGLGRGRTLVLLNDKRMVGIGPRNDQGDEPVDIGNFPSIALKQIELLKNGGSTLYGSDAIAGVFNYKTRGDFEGFELNTSYSDIDHGGDSSVGLIWGMQGDSASLVLSLEFEDRDQVNNGDLGLVDYGDPANGGWFIGVSSFGNPGTVWNPGVLGVAPIPFDPADPNTMFQVDANCDVQNGAAESFPMMPNPAASQFSACGFSYMPFSNVIDPQERTKVFLEGKVQIGENAELYGDVLYATLDSEYWGSPSFPPTQAGYFTFVPGPGAVAAGAAPAANPGYVDWLTNQVDPAYQATYGFGGLMWTRARAVSGPAAVLPREHETMRTMAGVRGEFSNEISYDLSVTYSKTDATSHYRDIVTDRYNMALVGLGGANCDAATGTGCEFWNPFWSSQTDPALANSDELWEHIWGKSGYNFDKDLLVFDAIFSGETGWQLGGGNVAWAAGAQYRDGELTRDAFGLWETTDPLAPTPYHFLGTAMDSTVSQDAWGVFGEVSLPMAEWAELNLALRHEDYDVDSTTNPKVSLAITPSESLLLRASYEKSFRVPVEVGVTQTVALIEGEYRLWENVPGAQTPEEADSYNFGVVWQPVEGLRMSADYYSIDLAGPFAVETIENVLLDNDPSKVVRDTDGNIQKVVTESINGPDTSTSGIDFGITYDMLTGCNCGDYTLGLEGAYVSSYEIAGYTTPGGQDVAAYEAAGNWNVRNSFAAYNLWSMPKLKYNAFVNGSWGNHSASLYARYVDDVALSDDDLNVPAYKMMGYGDKVDSWLTWDAHYGYTFESMGIQLGLSVINLTDEKPPLAPFELAYDPSAHNPLGRVVKANLTFRF